MSKKFLTSQIDDLNLLNILVQQFKQTVDVQKVHTGLQNLDFSSLTFSKKNIDEIILDLKEKGYDRSNKLWKKYHTFTHNFRTFDLRKNLPSEIISLVDTIIQSRFPKTDKIIALKPLLSYCQHKESLIRIAKLNESIKLILNKICLNYEEFKKIKNLIDKYGLSLVKNKIIEMSHYLEKIENLLYEQNQFKINDFPDKISICEQDKSKRIVSYIQNIINCNLQSKISSNGTLARRIIYKLSKAFGKGKKAFKTFDNLRKTPEEFLFVLDLIPVWLMELDDASRILPLKKNIFDYVILDEASQCNIAYTLPVMYRTKKAIFVGDSEQMRDSTIGFKSNNTFQELAKKHNISPDKQIKPANSAVQSVLDIARSRGVKSKSLKYHYRSPKELIGFSNENFYKPKGKDIITLNKNYITYKNKKNNDNSQS